MKTWGVSVGRDSTRYSVGPRGLLPLRLCHQLVNLLQHVVSRLEALQLPGQADDSGPVLCFDQLLEKGQGLFSLNAEATGD